MNETNIGRTGLVVIAMTPSECGQVALACKEWARMAKMQNAASPQVIEEVSLMSRKLDISSQVEEALNEGDEHTLDTMLESVSFEAMMDDDNPYGNP